MKPFAACGLAIALGGISIVGARAAPDDAQVIGGLTPDQRPASLPVITETGLTMFGMVRELHGVSKPYPPLDFLDDHQGFYTPFSRPGMTGPYDIRNWHGSND